MAVGGVFGRKAAVSMMALGALALAGCQSDNAADALDLTPRAGAGGEQVLQSDLRAYCPQVELREGTAYFSTYERGGQGDAQRLVYQASIGDVTRNCTHSGGTTTVNIAVAGRVVPGPKGRAGTITMPIRVAMVREGQVAYSVLHQHPVQVSDTIGATQFIFSNSGVSFPSGPQRIIIYAGYDEGPPQAPRRR